MAQHPIEGSERQPMEGATSIGRADPSERLEVSVILVRKGDAAMRERMGKLAADAEVGRHLTRPEFEAQFGADPNHIAAVRKFAGDHHLAVVQEHAGRRTVILSGTVGQVNEAFGVDLQRYRHPGGSYRGRVGSIHVPDELHGKVEAVLGLDNRPVARPHFRPRGANASRAVSYNPPQVAAMYGFPLGTGQGQCVAIIELGGGERSADLSTYFSQIGLRSAPNVTVVSVDQATNNPTTASSADGEVMLDIEVVGAVAPGANIAVYFTPNTDAGFLDAITTAIHDTTNKPSVISISWGGPESNWTQQAMTAMDNAFQAAATMGITVCVASGDNGSRDVPPGTRGAPGDHVDFPASSPHVLACGGTNLQGSGTSITSETVWNELPRGGAGGGGVSKVFPVPAWQNGLRATKTAGHAAALTMRGVPDVCGDADPESGYNVRIDGTNTVIGGTSAVARLWAGLLAVINATKGQSAGFVNAKLYANPGALNDITQGNNGDFAATAGWDACTGLGSPNGAKVAAVV